jgi:hypothetical protein
LLIVANAKGGKKISAVADNDVAIGFDGFFDFVLIDQPRIG